MRNAHNHPAAELLESARRSPAHTGIAKRQGWTARWSTSKDQGFRSVNITAPTRERRHELEASIAIVKACGLKPALPAAAGLLTYIVTYPKAFEEFTETDEAGEPRVIRHDRGRFTAEDREEFQEAGLWL